MKKKYLYIDVYEAFLNRIDYIFREFDNIIISFSGGKDSGLLLDMVLDFRRKYYPKKRICVFHQDFEAQYNYTTKYVERTFDRIKSEVEPYWVCLPTATRTAVSNYEMFWHPWDDTKQDIWVRKLPEHPYVVNLENNPITTYRYKMNQEELGKQFCRWYRKSHGNKKTVCLLGMRAAESLLRFNSFVNKKKCYDKNCWITEQFKDVWTASPLYDWKTSDVWHAIQKFGYDYNKLYDMYYMAGLKPEQMRVASPFNDYAKTSLNIYRVIEPDTWVKLVGRVKGANFAAIYGKTKLLGYKKLTLPNGYTWESFTKFLLDTLPEKIRKNYIKKFETSINFWHTVGGGLEEKVIEELEARGYKIKINGVSNYTIMKNRRVVFLGKIPDHTDDITTSKDIPSWKRMCYCIIKNDHICRFMGFSLTKEQNNRIKFLKEKYSKVE